MKQLHRALTSLLLLATAFCLGGWTPKAAWAPDARQAVVVGSDGLYLSDATGKLSARLAEGRFSQPVWFADGKRFAVAQYTQVHKWGDVQAALEPEDREAIEKMAKNLSRNATKAGLNWTGGVPAESLEAQAGRIPIEQLRLIVLRLRDGMDVPAADIIIKWKPEGGAKFDQASIHIVSVNGPAIEVGHPIAQSLNPIREVRVNDKQGLVAFTSPQFGPNANGRLGLWVMPASGATPSLVIERDVAAGVDWSGDGTQLVYIRAGSPKMGDRPRLGSLVRREIHQSEGAPAAAATRDELAGLIFNEGARVRSLRDGRIMFSSIGVALPAAKGDVSKRYGLFIADAVHGTVVPGVPGVPHAAPELFSEAGLAFELSPDERFVAMIAGGGVTSVAAGAGGGGSGSGGGVISGPASGGDGHCAIVSIASGEVTTVPIPSDGSGQPTSPAWRNAEELSLIARPAAWGGKEGRSELVLWSKTGCRVLSRDWPQEVMDMWE